MTRHTVVVPLRSFKLTWMMQSEKVPRDVLPPEGEGGEIEWQMKLEGVAAPVIASFNARNYRRMIKQLDTNPTGQVVFLQGYLTGGPDGLFLDRAGFRVDVARPKPGAGPGGPGGGPRPQRSGPPAPPRVEVVRRLK